MGRVEVSWAVPEFPVAPREGVEVREVPEAFLTRVQHGLLRSYRNPTRFIRGAVHDADGVLLPHSQKVGGFGGHPLAPADPSRVVVNRGAPRLAGRWLYGGHWIPHFGHFLVETLTTLWSREPAHRFDGLVFHQYLGEQVEAPRWAHRMLDLLGLGDLPVEVVGPRAGRVVERLVVPSRTVVVNGWADPRAVEVWDRLVAPLRPLPADRPRRVFLSRTAFHDGLRARGKPVRSTAERDRVLDDVFGAAGFAVVAPERLPVEEQLCLAAGADVLAGGSGSALHKSAVAPSSTRVVEVGDARNPHRPVGLQVVVDAVRGHPRAFLDADLDEAALTAALRTLLADLD